MLSSETFTIAANVGIVFQRRCLTNMSVAGHSRIRCQSLLSNATRRIGWLPDGLIAHADAAPHVNLKTPIRVLILYGTALATEDGAVMFFDDIYGHDRKLEGLLGLPLLTAGTTHTRM